ncbi:GNAT family N-acetyltransferase [Methanolobus halotolerans]|uniref:N-acetyltransferase n=1 Tax=Methanolobus halotolerans TaxID=2052935 RepID=A0A4E0PVN0_9EURY|nr:N-acetyltransferase [Methanolobus halotolerans]TGC09408.1 N-acetyltransferase [Methanolobus halotolerans]
MTVAALIRGFIWKIHVGKRQSVTASKLIMGSLVTQNWATVSDNHVTNVSDEMLKGMLRLYNENFSEINEKRFTKYALFFKKTTYVYTDNNEAKGYCLYYIKPSLSFSGLKKAATLYSFTVDNRCRRQGIGIKLLQKSILEMRLNSIDHIILYVATDNEAAINLYEKVGFMITEELPNICGPGKKCYKMEIRFDRFST